MGDRIESIWTKTAHLPKFEPLQGDDIKTDVLIIGGGMAGLLCAYRLSQAGADCILVEADRICGGITKNTTAKITSQHGLVYDKIIRMFDVETARLYLEANQAALDQYRTLCQDIDCDFVEQDAFVYTTDYQQNIDRELSALKKIGFPAQFLDRLPLPFPIAGAIRFERQAQFHPLKFAAAIVQDQNLRIFEHTKVLELSPGTAIVTNGGKISANHIIIATHFPILNKHGGYFLKLYQHRSYVLALKNAPDLHGMYLDENQKGLSFRNYQGLLLLGGGSHRTGKSGGGWRELEVFAHKYYPNAQIVARWATQDCMSLDNMPYIGRYSPHTPRLYVATGFCKWGMTSSLIAADILSDLILNKKNRYAKIFSPDRNMLRPQLAMNGLTSIIGLLTPTVPRCPHMGCALKYNPQEHSWDCPCHGSRFATDGTLIDNPATDDKK